MHAVMFIICSLFVWCRLAHQIHAFYLQKTRAHGIQKMLLIVFWPIDLPWYLFLYFLAFSLRIYVILKEEKICLKENYNFRYAILPLH
jgi:hypothetical protein